jgi:hypothetical protein
VLVCGCVRVTGLISYATSMLCYNSEELNVRTHLTMKADLKRRLECLSTKIDKFLIEGMFV